LAAARALSEAPGNASLVLQFMAALSGAGLLEPA
jgi:hypothetical protein